MLSIRPDGRALLVRTEHGQHRGRTVVCNADPTLVYGELLAPEHVPARLRRAVRASEPSVGMFYAYVVTDLDLPALGIGSASILHRDGPGAIARPNPHPRFDNYLLSCTTLKDPGGGHALPGEHIVELAAPAAFAPWARWADQPSMRRDEAYGQLKEELGWRLIRAAERYIPGLASAPRFVDFATPATNLYWVNAPGGGCYGPAHLPSQVGRRRFGNAGPLPGLFLCGHGTLAGGIYPSMRSGELAAGLAGRLLGL